MGEEEARYLAKRKMLDNIKFIGELGKLEMLHDSILHRCAEQLLVGRRKQSLNDQTEDIECLAHLMKTCGRLLDSAKAKMRMDQYFDRIRAIINNPDMPTRIKFLLQDVVEMRQNRWMPRKLATPDGPRTIQQVREDAARGGCIYLPQQESPSNKPPTPPTNQLQEVIFSKIRPKGMEDIFGGPADLGMNLGMGPGVIQGNDNNGFSNFGVVLGEVAKRGKGMAGLSSGNTLAAHVHPNLSESAALTCKAVDAFGQTVEKVLIKHGKGIINEQFVLNRLANATIDIYANSCVLSRCTKSLDDGVESAHHEEMLAKVWCSESYNRIMDNLNQLKNPEVLDNFKTMSKISEAVCEKVAPVQGNPLGF